MDEILSNIDSIVQYRAFLCGRISFLLEHFSTGGATVDDFKEMILEHDAARRPSECVADLITLFDAATEGDLDHVLPVIQEAWNYFPHRCLSGCCPAEVMVLNLAQPRNARRRKTIRY